MGSTWAYLDITALGRQEEWEDSPEGYPQTPPYQWWNYHDAYGEFVLAHISEYRWRSCCGAGRFRRRPPRRPRLGLPCTLRRTNHHMIGATTLRMERTFEAPAQSVFDAWTSEEVMRRWWHAEHDWETTEAEVDLRVGGEVRVVMRNPHEDIEYGGGGRYTEIDPPRRLAFTWLWDDNPARQLIELDFEETDGRTTCASRTAACGTKRPCARTRTDGGRFKNLERTLEATSE